MSKKDTEAEEIALRGWQECTMPLTEKIGGQTKGEIIQKLKQIIKDNSKLTYQIE